MPDMTIQEFARLTGRHVETLRRLARMGDLPGVYRLGGRWMIARASANKLRCIPPAPDIDEPFGPENN